MGLLFERCNIKKDLRTIIWQRMKLLQLFMMLSWMILYMINGLIFHFVIFQKVRKNFWN
ncbi:hypothetical protein LEQ41_09065 [Streptococcus agalactiae]|nr:hypothetical protein [Streptococcus agalactiae]